MNNVVIGQKIIISTIGLALAGNLTLIFTVQAATITGTGNARFEVDEDIRDSSEYGWTIDFQQGGGSGAAGVGPNYPNNKNHVVIAADSTKQWTVSIWNKNGSEDKSNWTMDDTPEYKKCSPKLASNSLINYFASVPYSIFGFFLGEPALAQTKGAVSGDISCSSSCVPEPITGVILGGLAAGGWMAKRKKQKSV